MCGKEVGTWSATLVEPSIAQGPSGLSSGPEPHGGSEESLDMHWCPMKTYWSHSSLTDTLGTTVVAHV